MVRHVPSQPRLPDCSHVPPTVTGAAPGVADPADGGCSAPGGWCAAWTSPRRGGSGSTRWPAICSRRPKMTWPTRTGPSRTPGWSGDLGRGARLPGPSRPGPVRSSARPPARAGRTHPTVAGPAEDLVQAVAVWVAITAADGRPVPLGDAFHPIYGPSTGGRQVSARLSDPGPPAETMGRPWPLRASDFDTAGHVNNSIHWARSRTCWLGWTGCRLGLSWSTTGRCCRVDDPRLLSERAEGQLTVWLCDDAAAGLGGAALAEVAGC